MKDAVIFHPARTIGETAGAAVEMGQNELATEYTESAHPYKQLAEVLHIADETKNRTGYVLFPKVTKFNTWLLSRYGKRLEAELTEGIMAGKYAVTMGLNDVTAAHISCRFSPRMSLWRVNRYEFIADVPVEINWKSSAGEETAEGYVSLNCCLDENFCYFIDGVSLEKPDRPLIRLDEYLVPIMSYEDLEAATRTMWEQYLPEVFTDHEWLNPYRLAERMGLKVTFHLLYRRKKKRGLLFWKDGTVKVVTHTDRNDLIEEVKIEAGTIVINDDGEDISKSRLAVYHECFHDEFHWLFFRLQEMHNDDLKTIQRVKKARNQGKEPRNPLKMLEWEAREGARMLMLPTEIIQPLILSRRLELKWTKHMGELYQGIIFGVAEDLNAARYQVRQRLLQLGYWQARGALNYIPHRDGTGRYIRPFMFARESCPTSAYTFVITPAESFNLYRDNAEYRERIDSGRYIYVEGHICINDPEYVLQGRQGPYMTRWANEHVDECCLRFLNVFETDEDYEFNLGYVCSDEEYNRHYIDFVTGGKDMTEEEVKDNQPGKTVERAMEPVLRTDGMRFLPQYSMDVSFQSDSGNIQRVSKLLSEAQADSNVAGAAADRCKRTLRKPQRQAVSFIWRPRRQILLSVRHSGGNLDSEKCSECTAGVRDGSHRQQRSLCAGEHPICSQRKESGQPARDGIIGMGSGILALFSKCGHQDAVFRENTGRNHRISAGGGAHEAKELEAHRRTARLYDIRNAGPHHRFTVSGRLVHNCGYGGGVGALKAMGAKMPEAEMQPLVDAWRAANPNIVAFWSALDRAARTVIRKKTSVRVGKVTLYWQDDKMFMRLPSGRNLCYQSPHFTTNRFGSDAIGYYASSASGQMVVQETFGGKLAENATQAIARDILANALMMLEAHGYPVVFHIHDEAVIEMPIGQGSLEEACRLMAIAPDWAEGLPMRADGEDDLSFYRKT